MSEVREVVAARGTASNGANWTLLYRPEGGGVRHHLALFVNGGERESASGFDIPDTTEIGFRGGLAPGNGSYYLYGLVTSRIHSVRAESEQEHDRSDVLTATLSGATANDGGALRSFVIVRPPVDNVTALVGLDQEGREVQRISLP
ncbi:hypothetical protein HNR19_002762 [Nocardioides thalensis]|uniref:Uncharacterized protein n=1 Tax=Nocardioides thalensis TaxID=1914755 RepID=A0A853C3S7_9ACTN|nr:hypothetical protein [Nocardioides thalensis]NYJ02064.1 hypothetical protein [Nocardioides thalensis]